jgi:hypothetical protein
MTKLDRPPRCDGPEDVWPCLVGYEHGTLVRVMLAALASVPVDVLSQAIQDIDDATAFGPLFDPSSWTDGFRFDNAHQYRDVIKALRDLRRLLPEPPQ